jgi:hypothetical protein
MFRHKGTFVIGQRTIVLTKQAQILPGFLLAGNRQQQQRGAEQNAQALFCGLQAKRLPSKCIRLIHMLDPAVLCKNRLIVFENAKPPGRALRDVKYIPTHMV